MNVQEYGGMVWEYGCMMHDNMNVWIHECMDIMNGCITECERDLL